MEIWLFNLQHTSVLKAQPQQRISNIYIYLHVSDQSVYTGAKTKVCDRARIEMFDSGTSRPLTNSAPDKLGP